LKDRDPIALRDVPETLLWPLYNRASWAGRPGALLHDPRAIEICNSIDDPFARHFGPPSAGPRTIDTLIGGRQDIETRPRLRV
jgi:O-methyltransferase involved in polyketide biosynthesis